MRNQEETNTPEPAEPVTPIEPVSQVQTAAPPTGVVNSAASPPASEFKAPETKPVTTEVDEEKGTVAGQLNALTSSGSSYLELNKNEAMRETNSRGLVNSTMAAGAGRDAAIRNALPVAQQDAKTYNDNRLNNQGVENDFLKNRQSADLNKETAAQQNLLDINRDNNSSQLNESLAAFESELKKSEMTLDSELQTAFETTINDEKFSDESKLRIIDTMNSIILDTNQQITDIGLSDRSARQQAVAIDIIKKNRDAELAVYQDLLTSFNDWDWGTDFTPEATTTLAQDNNYWNAPGGQQPVAEPKIGSVIDGQSYQGNGIWQEYYDDYDPYDN